MLDLLDVLSLVAPISPSRAVQGAIRTFKNDKGDGRLFSVDFIDESGEMRGTAFGEQCDRLFPLLEKGRIYHIRNGRIKPANKKFSSVNNDHEITFDDNTVIELVPDDPGVPQQKVCLRARDICCCQVVFVRRV